MYKITVENIKCGGCAGNIKSTISAMQGVQAVDVDIESGVVDLQVAEPEDGDAVLVEVKAKLKSMGYPEQGSVEGLSAAGAKAKSYVSCAIGKMNKN